MTRCCLTVFQQNDVFGGCGGFLGRLKVKRQVSRDAR